MADFAARLFALVILSLRFVNAASQSCTSSSSLGASPSSSKTLTSPGFPLKDYGASINCKWTITAPIGYSVQINFTDFRTPDRLALDDDCSFYADVLRVYDSKDDSGRVLGIYCGDNLPAIVISTGRYLHLTFSSYYLTSPVGSRKGFRLLYRAVLLSSGSSAHTCTPFNDVKTNENIKLKANTFDQEIKSPLYPKKYPSNMNCIWYITASSDNMRILITFSNVIIYSHWLSNWNGCNSTTKKYETLVIKDGPSVLSKEIKSICASRSMPTMLLSSGRHMTIQFNSIGINHLKNNSISGFILQYREISRDSLSVSPEMSCSPVNSYHGNTNIKLKASNTAKKIKSPLYPYKYPINIECTWYITASSSSKGIELTLSDVKMYNHQHDTCSEDIFKRQDVIVIRDSKSYKGKILKTVCSDLDSPTTVRSSNQYMTIEFTADANDYFPSRTPSRFLLSYREYTIIDVGMIVGITFGSLFLISCFLVIFACWWRRRKRSNQNPTINSQSNFIPLNASNANQNQAGITAVNLQTPDKSSFPSANSPAYPIANQFSYPTENHSINPQINQSIFPVPAGCLPAQVNSGFQTSSNVSS